MCVCEVAWKSRGLSEKMVKAKAVSEDAEPGSNGEDNE